MSKTNDRLIDAFKTQIGVISERAGGVRGIETPLKYFYKGDKDKIKSEIQDNTEEFQANVLKMAQKVKEGIESEGVAYAVICMLIADYVEIPYDLFASVSVLPNSEKKERLSKEFEEKKSDNDEHPVNFTNIYVEIGEQKYENYRGTLSDIIHIDSTKIDLTEDK